MNTEQTDDELAFNEQIYLASLNYIKNHVKKAATEKYMISQSADKWEIKEGPHKSFYFYNKQLYNFYNEKVALMAIDSVNTTFSKLNFITAIIEYKFSVSNNSLTNLTLLRRYLSDIPSIYVSYTLYSTSADAWGGEPTHINIIYDTDNNIYLDFDFNYGGHNKYPITKECLMNILDFIEESSEK